MNKNNTQKEKLSRAIIIANNKKKNEINNILSLRNEMIENSIDSNLIKKFIDEEYEKINKNYEDKIKKSNSKSNNSNIKNKIKNIKKKREKAIDFLLKNKTFLEEHGASKEYIKKYIELQYQEINEFYDIKNINLDNDINNDNDNDNIDFID